MTAYGFTSIKMTDAASTNYLYLFGASTNSYLFRIDYVAASAVSSPAFSGAGQGYYMVMLDSNTFITTGAFAKIYVYSRSTVTSVKVPTKSANSISSLLDNLDTSRLYDLQTAGLQSYNILTPGATVAANFAQLVISNPSTNYLTNFGSFNYLALLQTTASSTTRFVIV